ncbi:phosphoglycerate mutase-like protein [Amniculicola lignicola CBS 123094]|uniref:Phosphoglycerate mutase-like protein n=1 Tax=Amniculicola lignicola CBS 123094 TaxID=1392246 RepID=A0A6A5W071_9PLEO|nr:phosphoglycerate mutase-like protein [Amniculicola lignicola CBS 123094]
MRYSIAAPVLALLASAEGAETILGAYMFHRHGDRTPKSLAPTNLTTLGYEQGYTSGQYYRSRYLTGPSKIYKLNEDIVKLNQIAVTSPTDNVLQISAMAFLQGLYPPVGQTIQVLANGDKVQAPMDGYQLIPVNTVEAGSGSEDNGWLQAATGCYKATTSSNNYFSSSEYESLLSSTADFYKQLVPVVNGTLAENYVTYKNAYIVYDLINVATIHNTSIPSSSTLTATTLLQTRTLADTHEWNLAFNASSPIRSIAGMQLAGEILTSLNSTITSGTAGKTANKLAIQFGAYATFLSFFGLANLPAANADFTGVPDYASVMVFELFTTVEVAGGYPAKQDIQVRFLFHNGTTTEASEPVVYPLFGGASGAVSWVEFEGKMRQFAVLTTEEWCGKCGNTTGACAAYAGGDGGEELGARGKGAGGMSAAVGGVVGAFVALGVVFLVLGAGMLLGGLRLVSRKGLGAGKATQVVERKV